MAAGSPTIACSIGFAAEVACFLILGFFLLSQRVLPALLHQASAPLPKRVFELVSQLKFPGSVLTLVFPGSVLGLPWSSLRVSGELPRAHLELALTATRQAQHHCTEQ